jgi:DNA gyrase subunit B
MSASETPLNTTGSKGEQLINLEAIRRNPGMFIGSVSTFGLHQLILEAVESSLQTANQSKLSNTLEIEVEIAANQTVTVSDNGSGLATGFDTERGKSLLELATTRFNTQTAKNFKGNLVLVNAFSEWLLVEVKREGQRFWQIFLGGIPQAEVQTEPLAAHEAEADGTHLQWLSDSSIFEPNTTYNHQQLAHSLQEKAYFNPSVTIKFRDVRSPNQAERVFHYPKGFVTYLQELNQVNQFHLPIYAKGEVTEVGVEVALQYQTNDLETLVVFTNQKRATPEGTPVAGLRNTITRTINRYAHKYALLPAATTRLTGNQLRQGLSAILSITIAKPEYKYAWGGTITNPEAKRAVNTVLGKALAEWLEAQPESASKIVTNALVKDHKAKMQEAFSRDYLFKLLVGVDIGD